MDNFIRAVLYIFVTCIAQFLGFILQEEVAKDIRGLLYGIPIVLFILACWHGKTIFIYKKRAEMAERPASFHPDCIDCYVSFTGKMAEGQEAIMPLSEKSCAFYMTTIQREWQTMQKKPGNDMETHQKHLMRDQSSKELTVTGRYGTVHVSLSTFNKDQLTLRELRKSQSNCPLGVIDQKGQKHNPVYHLIERFIEPQDTVSIQGRLVQKKDGRLFIEGTNLFSFPSFILVHQSEKSLEQFVEELKEKAETDACSMGLRAFFFALNGAVFLYFF